MPAYAIYDSVSGQLVTVQDVPDACALKLEAGQAFRLLLEAPDLFFVKWDTCKRQFIERCMYGRAVWLGELLGSDAYVGFYMRHGQLEPAQQLELLDEIETILRTI